MQIISCLLYKIYVYMKMFMNIFLWYMAHIELLTVKLKVMKSHAVKSTFEMTINACN